MGTRPAVRQMPLKDRCHERTAGVEQCTAPVKHVQANGGYLWFTFSRPRPAFNQIRGAVRKMPGPLLEPSNVPGNLCNAKGCPYGVLTMALYMGRIKLLYSFRCWSMETEQHRAALAHPHGGVDDDCAEVRGELRLWEGQGEGSEGYGTEACRVVRMGSKSVGVASVLRLGLGWAAYEGARQAQEL